MSSQQASIQESQYGFPYHYLVDWDGHSYFQHRSINWGYVYLSYLHFVRERVLEILEETPDASVLDVGCGDGRFLHNLSRDLEPSRLTGLDYSQAAVTLAQSFTPDVGFVCGDVTTDCFHGRLFQVATLIDVFEHIPPDQAEAFVAGIRRHLAPGGNLLVTVPHVNTSVQKKHYRHFDAAQLAESMAPHFIPEETIYLNRRLGPVAKLVRRLLANKVFQIDYQPLLGRAFRWYLDNKLVTDEADCTRVFTRFRAA